jgi:hypothetical protein
MVKENESELKHANDLIETEPPAQEKPIKKKRANLLVYTILIVVVGFLAYFPQYIGTVVILAIGAIISFGIIWYRLAPSETLYNFMQESTGKIIVSGGAFVGALIQKTGSTYDECWTVVPEDKNHKEPWHIGGLRFNGRPFMDEVFRFPKKRISDSSKPGFEDEIVSSFSVKPEQYEFKIEDAETRSVEKTRITLDVLFKGIIETPPKFFFGAPDNAIDKCIESLNAFFTNVIATKTTDEVLAVGKNPNILWEEIKNDIVIKNLRDIQGFRIEENSVQFTNIQMQDSVQKAAEERGIERDKATARADKMTGTLLTSMANILGKTIPEVQAEINANPDLQKVFLNVMVDLTTRQLAIDGDSLVDIRLSGAKGEGDNPLTSALVQAMTIMNKTNLGVKKGSLPTNDGKVEEKKSESDKQEKAKKDEEVKE